MNYAIICDNDQEVVGMFALTNKKMDNIESIVNRYGLSYDVVSQKQLDSLVGYRQNSPVTLLRMARYLPSAGRAVGKHLPRAGKSIVKGSKSALKQLRSLTRAGTKTTKTGTKLAKSGTQFAKEATKLATGVGATAIATEVTVGSLKRTKKAITGEEKKKKKKKKTKKNPDSFWGGE